MTLRATHIPARKAPLFYGLAGVLGALLLLALMALLRLMPVLAVLKMSWVFVPGVVIIALLLIKVRRLPRAEQLVVMADGDGISLQGRAPVPWAEVEAVFLMDQNIGYGPKEFFGVRKRFTPNGTGAKWAERKVRSMLTDRSVALTDVGMDRGALLDALDTELARAGLMRTEKRHQERGAYRLSLWPLGPLNASSEREDTPD